MVVQHDCMKLISLHGTDDRLYELVARLVMSPEVLRYNNNYPFKTTPQHCWHICITNGEVVGFMPLKTTRGGLSLDNYYIRDDNSEIIDALLNHILDNSDKPVTALSHKRHTDIFRRHGFITSTVFAQYNRMQFIPGKGDSD